MESLHSYRHSESQECSTFQGSGHFLNCWGCDWLVFRSGIPGVIPRGFRYHVNYCGNTAQEPYLLWTLGPVAPQSYIRYLDPDC